MAMRVYLTSYATPSFQSVQRDLNISGVQFGISNIISYSEHDLHCSEYYRQNQSILDEICGAGYWAWKPFFILEALERLRDGDVLFYCDAGTIFVRCPSPLVELAREHPQGMIVFDARPLTNRQFTKRDCFVRLGCDEPMYWNANKAIATIVVLCKRQRTLAFIREWLSHCSDRAVITDDPNVCGQPDLPGYLQHRWDQAILSVLAAKHGLETFRNPTLWGNFLKLPEYRVRGEPVLSPYNLIPEISTYSKEPQKNSPYGTLFVINRQPNWKGKKPIPIATTTSGTKPTGRESFARRLVRSTKRRYAEFVGG